MRNAILIAPVLLLAACTMTDKEDSTRTEETRNINGFHSIHVYGSPTVHYRQGYMFSVKVVAPESRMRGVKTTVKDSTLSISEKRDGAKAFRIMGTTSRDNGIDIYVTSPDMTGASLTGSGDFICTGPVDTDKIRIFLKGSGDIRFDNIICDEISTALTGSGDIKLKEVETIEADIRLTGSGDMSTRLKNTDATYIRLSGSGDISVDFEKCATAKSVLKGSGDIRLKGTLGRLEKQRHGAGDYHTRSLTLGH